MAQVLIDLGADIEIRDPDRDVTPIQYAVVYAKRDLIPLLLSHGARTDFTDGGGGTLLGLALRASEGGFEEYDDLPRPREYLEIVEVLKKLGVG